MELELGKIVTEDIAEQLKLSTEKLDNIYNQEKLDNIDNQEKVKKREYYFIKKLVIESGIYPQIEIEQLDLCPDGSETFDVWIKFCANMRKDELFEFLKTANSRTASVLLYKDDQLPSKITIETFPRLKDLKEK